MYAAAYKVDNLISTIDYNNAQIDGSTDDVLAMGDLRAKWEAFGWHVLEMNGNVIQEVIETLHEAQSLAGNGKPIMIIMKTEMG